MPRLRAATTTVVVLILMIAGVVSDGAVAITPQARRLAPWNAGRPGTYYLHLNGGPLDVAREAPRRRLFILNAWERGLRARIKATNPRAVVLVYKDLSSTRTYTCHRGVDDRSLPTGVGYCNANRHHPGWFLTGPHGGRLRYGGYPDHFQMDVGNPGYQRRWVANVRADLRAGRWDGVMMDNALTRCDEYHAGVCPRRYPTHEAFRSAYRSMLRRVGWELRRAGFFTMANISQAYRSPGVWGSYIAPLNGGFEEQFAAYSSGHVWDWGPSGWRDHLAEVRTAVGQGKVAAVRSNLPAGDASLAYGLATYLLAADGRALFSAGYDNRWFPAYAVDLGRPRNRGHLVRGRRSVFRRDFTRGVVIVNASERNPYAVRFGVRYRTRSGRLVRAVTVPGQRAVVLRRA